MHLRDTTLGISLKPSDAVDDDTAQVIPTPLPDEPRVMLALQHLRVMREAQRRFDKEEREHIPLPDFVTLQECLRRPRDLLAWSIPGWQPAHSRVLCSGQAKVGKSQLVGNYIRSRVDGDPWLGVTDVVPLTGTLVLIDCEMNASHLVDWLAAQHIRRDDRVVVIPLRGLVSAFDILDRKARTWWATELRRWRAQCLVLDCLRPVLDALGLDEHTEAGRFLVAFDALLKEAEIEDAVVIHHMGHLSERARGDSRLRDWPDVEWRMMRQSDESSSPRFISAYGRDVDQPERQLAYDATSRRLTICGGSRQDTKIDNALTAIIGALTANPEPRSGRMLKTELREANHARKDLDSALKMGRDSGRLVVTIGSKNAFLYSVPVSRSVP